MKAATFKKKYGDPAIYTGDTVGVAVINSLVYRQLVRTERRKNEDTSEHTDSEIELFTAEYRQTMKDSIVSEEQVNTYLRYRRLEGWLVSRRNQAMKDVHTLYLLIKHIYNECWSIMWAEGVGANIAGINEYGDLLLAKLDARRFAYDDAMESDILSWQSELSFYVNEVYGFNKAVSIIAEENNLPQLEYIKVPLDEYINDNIEGYNNDILPRIKQTLEDFHGKEEPIEKDEEGKPIITPNSIRYNSLRTYLKPLDAKPTRMPKDTVDFLRRAVKDLLVFGATGGEIMLDNALRCKKG